MGAMSARIVLCAWICLILASFSAANPVEPAHGRMRNARQNPQCPGISYTSKNGLRFAIHCDQNLPGNVAYHPIRTDSMEGCMELCSRFNGRAEGCFGIVYQHGNNSCSIRNSRVSTQTLEDDTIYHSAIVDRTQMVGSESSCPFPDLSEQKLDDGVGYKVYCDKDLPKFDYCPDGYPSCNDFDARFKGFFHATSLQDCLGFCVKQNPPCRGVSYIPGPEVGFANCLPKFDFMEERLGIGYKTKVNTVHSAAITTIGMADTECPSAKTYRPPDFNQTFTIHCGQSTAGTNITSIRTQNITSCIDACTTSDRRCVSILFDPTSTGYQNCHLQDSTGPNQPRASVMFATLSGNTTSAPNELEPPTNESESPTNNFESPEAASKSASKVWLAGPVVGGIVLISLIAGGLIWRRRRKGNAASQSETKLAFYKHEVDGRCEMDSWTPAELVGSQPKDPRAQELETKARPQELPGRDQKTHNWI